MRRKYAADDFWKKLNKTETCWNWTGQTCKDGYGKIKRSGKTFRTHRYAYMLVYGAINNGLWVLHRCDNPACCNPEHLFLGTALDNNLDKIKKGRDKSPKGAAHWTNKFAQHRDAATGKFKKSE